MVRAAERVTKKEADGEHPASDYAHVPDPSKPSTWQLRIDNARHVGGAAAALGPEGYRGNKVEIPAADRPAVIRKVRAAWKKFHPDAPDDEMPEGLRASEPGVNAVHVNAPLGSEDDEVEDDGEEEATGDNTEPADKPSKRYHQHLIGQLKQIVSPSVFQKAVARARGHAGGTAERKRANWGYGDDSAYLADSAQNADDYYDGDGDNDADDGAQPKLEKADARVKYHAPAKDVTQRCGMCRFFSEDAGACQIVEGAINSNGVCNLFSPMVSQYGERPYAATVRALRFAEAPEWIPYLPKPGKYQHPSYGTIDLSPERIDRFVQNFQEAVYQDRLPIDAEHETKQSGAVGWIRELRKAGDGSVEARVEWTDRGRAFLEQKRFAYFSPEWYDEWQDAAPGGRKHRDIAIGGALTTRPFFKPGSLRPLAAGEKTLPRTWLPIQTKEASMGGTHSHEHTHSDGTTHSHEHGHGDTVDLEAKGHDETAHPHQHPEGMQMSENQAKRFADLEAELKAFKEREAKRESELKNASETIARMQADAQTKRFTDEVLGRNSVNGTRWIGPVDKHVGMLSKLAKAFGEESEEVRDYIAEHRATAEQIRMSNLFTEIGSEAFGDGASAEQQFDAAVKKVAAEKKINYDAATEVVQRENPELARRYAVEMRGGR